MPPPAPITRCFLAFEFDAETLAYLKKQVEPAHRMLAEEHGWPVRLIRPENWHVTLLFFDGLEEDERARVWREAARAVADGAWREPAFAWQGLSLWPTPRRPSLVCLEAGQTDAGAGWPLTVACEPFSKGDVAHYLAYRPHATVMRLRRGGKARSLGRDWQGLRDKLPSFDAARIRCDRVSLFLSTLSREQPVYPREFTARLG